MISLPEAKRTLLKLLPQAGGILLRYFGRRGLSARSKGGVDFVTVADLAVERFLIAWLKKSFPDSAFLAEETAPKNFKRLEKKQDLWIIDPLDGTASFSRHHPDFAVSVALAGRGEVRCGAIYLPFFRKLYWASKAETSASVNGRRLSVAKTASLATSFLATGWPWELPLRATTAAWQRNLALKVRALHIFGSSVADLAAVAEGRLDGYFHCSLKPWDTAAAALMIEKAGGRVTDVHGQPRRIFEPTILASNGRLHNKILKFLK
ncbi:MAG: inositol monophosphatase [Candidatus Doudnabacteria bacterium]|nr:inositol monophosphatase [Candidatus Doudnabacteria bacterium]